MGTSKKPEIEEAETVEVNQKLLDQFSKSLEKAINQVCKKNSKVDVRLELLIALGSFAAQVSQDVGQESSDFLELMEQLYEDSLEEPEEDLTETSSQDKMFIN